MRAEMAAHKPPPGPLDAKLLRGGLVDCEFIVHYLQLRERIAFRPALGEAIGELVAAGLLPASFAAHQALMARLLVAARLLAPDCDASAGTGPGGARPGLRAAGLCRAACKRWPKRARASPPAGPSCSARTLEIER